MRHTIQKQIIELSLPKGVDAFALQQRVSDRFYLDILPELEKHFNELSAPDQTLTIEKLEIDLGNITEEMIDSGSWIIPLQEALEKQLQQTLQDISGQDGGTIEPVYETSFRHWFYFIRNGHLRWNASRPSADWLDQILEAIAKNYLRAEQVRNILLNDQTAVKRIVLHHSETFLSHLVELLTAKKQNKLPEEIRQLTDSLLSKKSGFFYRELEKKLWSAVLNKAAQNQPQSDTKTIIRHLQKEWLPEQTEVQLKKKENQDSNPKKQETEKGAEENAIGFEKETEFETESLTTEGIYINHAGLILLHPFLSTYFRKLGLVVNGGFIDSEAQERAVCLLHLLVFSDVKVPEYDLVLPKLLCGLPLQKPVNTAIDFTPEEKEEAENLLTAVVEQWEVLKNTSLPTFRETFLQREGKLFCQDANWYLQVEKKPFDILLSHLPWTIGMVKLPWMKDLLRVEWL